MSLSFDPQQFVDQLRDLLGNLPARVESLTGRKLQSLRQQIKDAITALERFEQQLDPIKQPNTILDPSDPQVIAELIARTLLEQPRVSLANVDKFYGSGVYAIYYGGTFPAYELVSNQDHPLYVGKADPAKPDAKTVEEQETRLERRLRDHERSINSVENLDIDDLTCRYLVVKSAWQKTAEEYLIEHFKPVWNNEMKICEGFGKHGDSPTTRANTRSPWDTIHPGRPWATKEGNIPNPDSKEDIIAAVVDHLRSTVITM